MFLEMAMRALDPDTQNWREKKQRPTSLGDQKNRPEGVPMHKTNDVEPDYERGKKHENPS